MECFVCFRRRDSRARRLFSSTSTRRVPQDSRWKHAPHRSAVRTLTLLCNISSRFVSQGPTALTEKIACASCVASVAEVAAHTHRQCLLYLNSASLKYAAKGKLTS